MSRGRLRPFHAVVVALALAATSAASVATVLAGDGPTARVAAGSFALGGNVQTPRELSVAELAALPNQRTLTVTYAAGGTPETHTFTGPRLRDVLALAGPRFDPAIRNDRLRSYVSVTATDSYQALVGWGELDPNFESKEILLAVTQDGASLAAAGPRLVVPGDAAGGRYVTGVNSVVLHKPASAILEATTPLQASVGSLTSALAAKTSELTTRTAELGGVKGDLTRARAQIDELTAQLRPLRLMIALAPKKPARLSDEGLSLALSGPARQTVRARVMVSAAAARKDGLRSRVIAVGSATTAADGTAGVLLRATAPAATALRRHAGKLDLLAEATTGDRRALAATTVGD
jgi:hypothetical protein